MILITFTRSDVDSLKKMRESVRNLLEKAEAQKDSKAIESLDRLETSLVAVITTLQLKIM